MATRTTSITSMPRVIVPSNSLPRTTVAPSLPSEESNTSVTMLGLASSHSCRGQASKTSRIAAICTAASSAVG